MTMFQYYKRSRHFVFSAFIAFVFVLLCQNTAFARASSNGDLPTKADLQAQLDSLNKQKDLSAQDKLVQQDLTDTLATLDKIDRIKEETVQLRQKVAEAPEKMRQATAALTALSDVDNDGDGTFYSTVQDCIDDGNNADICARGWNNAKAAFYADVPKNMTQQNCQSKYENCYYDNVEQSWIPVISGFLLSRVIRKDRDEQFVYNSGGSSFASRPVWRNTSGDYSWRSGSGKKESYSSGGFTTKKASTVSRGGYGRSSSARGHWGG